MVPHQVIPGMTIDTEAGKVSPPNHKLWHLLTLVDIPATQHRMVQKDLEHLVEKIRFMHLEVPGEMAHL